MKWRANEQHGLEPIQEAGEATPAFVYGIVRQYKAYQRSGGQRRLTLPQRPVDMRKLYWPGIAQLMRMSIEERRGVRTFPQHMREALASEPLIVSRKIQSINVFNRAWRKLLSLWRKTPL